MSTCYREINETEKFSHRIGIQSKEGADVGRTGLSGAVRMNNAMHNANAYAYGLDGRWSDILDWLWCGNFCEQIGRSSISVLFIPMK